MSNKLFSAALREHRLNCDQRENYLIFFSLFLWSFSFCWIIKLKELNCSPEIISHNCLKIAFTNVSGYERYNFSFENSLWSGSLHYESGDAWHCWIKAWSKDGCGLACLFNQTDNFLMTPCKHGCALKAVLFCRQMASIYFYSWKIKMVITRQKGRKWPIQGNIFLKLTII